jgi:two-component system, OmpR family, osmolarity sensor histidine kinase EnvZ
LQPIVSIKGKKEGLRRALSNIISNAVRFGQNVRIALERQDNNWHISVDDDGIGLDPKHYEDAFRPFHRLDMGRNQDTAHVGLGLSIARDIVHGHGGDIALGVSDLGGLRVNMTLPVQE